METWYLERREAAAEELAAPGMVESRLAAKTNGRTLVLTPSA